MSERVYVAMRSWAGTTFHAADLVKINPKRSRVEWVERAGMRGKSSLVPNGAILTKPEMKPKWLRFPKTQNPT